MWRESGPRRDQTGPRSQILAAAGLKARLPAFSAASEGLPGCCPTSPSAGKARTMKDWA